MCPALDPWSPPDREAVCARSDGEREAELPNRHQRSFLAAFLVVQSTPAERGAPASKPRLQPGSGESQSGLPGAIEDNSGHRTLFFRCGIRFVYRMVGR